MFNALVFATVFSFLMCLVIGLLSFISHLKAKYEASEKLIPYFLGMIIAFIFLASLLMLSLNGYLKPDTEAIEKMTSVLMIDVFFNQPIPYIFVKLINSLQINLALV